MVCTLGRGRMAAIVRILETRKFSEITAEEASHEKLAAQSIHRELREADEANLLEEEDMHVFDCKPMADPLHLVCCNACKKPIKASQYAAHAERCRLLNSTEEGGLELDGGTGHKKPPRKGRKKLQTARDQATVIGEQERPESVDADDTVPSESNLDDQIGMAYSFSKEAKISDAPFPLATKIYHSQRNNRLRSALNHLYSEASRNWSDSLSSKLVQGSSMLPLQDSPPKNLLHEQTDNMPQKKDMHAVQKPDQILAQSSELCLGNSGGYPSVMNFSNQFRDNSFSSPALPVDAAQMDVIRNSYLSTTYSFPGNSGRSLGTMQQSNGSVSVT